MSQRLFVCVHAGSWFTRWLDAPPIGGIRLQAFEPQHSAYDRSPGSIKWAIPRCCTDVDFFFMESRRRQSKEYIHGRST
jgi:hypothetical protein